MPSVISQDKESERHKEQLSAQMNQTCMENEDLKSTVLGNASAPNVNGSQEYVVDEEEEAELVLEKGSCEACHEEHLDTDFSKTENLNAATTDIPIFSGKEEVPAASKSYPSGEEVNDVLYNQDGCMEMDLKLGKEINQSPSRSSSLGAPRIRTRSLSPLSEKSKDGNKRAAVICDFFAKGWCIKGSSCRFLHIKDHGDNTSQRSGEDVPSNQKREPEIDEGSREIYERSKLPGSPQRCGSSIRSITSSSHFVSECVPSVEEHREKKSWLQYHESHKSLMLQREDSSSGASDKHKKLILPKDDPKCFSKDVERGSPMQSCYKSDYGKYASSFVEGSSPIHGSSLLPGNRSFPGNSTVSLNTYRSSGLSSSYAVRPEELVSNSPPMFNDSKSIALGRTLTSGLNTFRPTKSRHIPAWTGSSLSFSSSVKPDPFDSLKPVDSNGGYCASKSASLQSNCLPFSESEPANMRKATCSGDPPSSAGYKTKVSLGNWEPSPPFRPSFFFSPSFVAGNEYDPFRDSIEQGMPAHRFSDISASGHLSKSQQQNHATNEKSLFTITGEMVETSFANPDSRTSLPNEEMELGSDNVKEVTKGGEIHTNQGSRRKSGVARHKRSKVDGHVHKDSKELRHFRAALVDCVKELMKPTWREGHLSKDIHKMIVKKAVDKVLSTLQASQIPSTVDAIKLYLSSSRPKMVKLVEGYIEKYGKSELPG